MTRALVILGHGSRAPGAAEDMERVALVLGRRHPDARIRVSHMELCEPSLGTVVAGLSAEGVEEVTVIPYFLHRGNHLREDIPMLLRDLAGRFPGLRLILGSHLGFDESLASVVEARWREAERDPLVIRAGEETPCT